VFQVEMAKRIKDLPPYPFARIDEIKAEQIARGVDVIDLTIGDPDLPTPEGIVVAMKAALENPEHHRYPSYVGMLSLREAIAAWYLQRFQVELDPKTEVIILIGSKEGIAHIPLAFIDPGDYGLVPDPGYPVYRTSVLFAGGTPYSLPLTKENHYLPELEKIPETIARQAKLLFLNYPNNPTAAVATKAYYEEVVRFCRTHNIIVCHDAPYSEIYYDDLKPASFLEVPGAKEVAIEFHSLSKTFNMTGWRLGFAVGNAEIIAGLGKVKTNIDSGAFHAVQEAGIAAFQRNLAVTETFRRMYQERRDLLVAGLTKMGLQAEPPLATFYVWVPVPAGYTSMEFTARLLDQTGVLATPGNGFGACGEGYVRFSLTAPTERIKEAVERLRSTSF
jgi:LL-diaminopimelate aminotransferase